jgi:hypothetical protein
MHGVGGSQYGSLSFSRKLKGSDACHHRFAYAALAAEEHELHSGMGCNKFREA